jgi:hypothetical protein
VCKQLGYPGAEFYSTGSYFGKIPQKFALDEVDCKGLFVCLFVYNCLIIYLFVCLFVCKGTESQLLDCNWHSGKDNQCTVDEAAGVVCRPISGILGV